MYATKVFCMFVGAPLLAFAGAAIGQPPHEIGTAFTYQGRLVKDGVAVTDTCDFEFTLWDDPTAGTQQSPTETHSGVDAVDVSDGLFTVGLDFGPDIFIGEGRWLAMSVCCPSTCAVVPLTGRQELTPTPYALALPGLWTQQNGVDEAPNLIGGYSGNSVTDSVQGATISGGGNAASANRVTDDYGTVGGGWNNQAGSDDGFTSNDTYSTVGGGADNIASGIYSTVGGGRNNEASGTSSTVAGGGFGIGNTASGDQSTISGGSNNTASEVNATVSGGAANTASANASTVGGGGANTASAPWATVGGGDTNQAGGTWATVGGGDITTRPHPVRRSLAVDQPTFWITRRVTASQIRLGPLVAAGTTRPATERSSARMHPSPQSPVGKPTSLLRSIRAWAAAS